MSRSIRSNSIRSIATGAAVLALVTACSDAPTAPMPRTFGAQPQESDGMGWLQRYVAMGTSVSMGVASAGVSEGSQRTAWPALLAEMAGREMSLPLIQWPGCRPPFQAPLATGKRISGEAAGADPATLSCAPNVDGITLPAANVAIDRARASDALSKTPATASGQDAALYARVFPADMTQVSAMEAQNPKFVSVELGANEVLGASSGIAIPGASIVPPAVFKAQYDEILERVAAKVNKGAVLVGLIDDVASFPAFRRGSELYAARQLFLALRVVVDENCNGSDNLVFVPRVVVGTIGFAASLPAGLTAPLSCAGGAATAQDGILTPSEAAVVNAVLADMDAHIAQRAQERGWAHFRLDALYGRSDLKAPFNPITLMTTAQPYGPLISLDGVHPSAQGQMVLATAAAEAINATFNLGIPVGSPAFIARR